MREYSTGVLKSRRDPKLKSRSPHFSSRDLEGKVCIGAYATVHCSARADTFCIGAGISYCAVLVVSRHETSHDNGFAQTAPSERTQLPSRAWCDTREYISIQYIDDARHSGRRIGSREKGERDRLIASICMFIFETSLSNQIGIYRGYSTTFDKSPRGAG